MTTSRPISVLLTLLLAVSLASNCFARTTAENYLENASPVVDGWDTAWLEYDEDANDIDSLTRESISAEIKLTNSHALTQLFSLLDIPRYSNRPIRAPPLPS